MSSFNEEDRDLLAGAMRSLAYRIAVKQGETPDYASVSRVDYDNVDFSMHYYCTCERSSCPWCRDCDCPLDELDENADDCSNEQCNLTPLANFIHKPTGMTLSWYKHPGRGMSGYIPDGVDIFAVFAACAQSIENQPVRKASDIYSD